MIFGYLLRRGMMKHRFLLWLFSAGLLLVGVNPGTPPDIWAGQPISTLTSTRQQREEISITVYQQNLGLVSEVRTLRLQPGLNQVQYLDTAEAIDPGSVYVQFPDHSGQIKIQEQEFGYDLLTPQTLLHKYIGQPIELYEKIEGQIKEKITPGILLSVGEPNIYQIEDKIHLGHPGRLVVNKLAQGIVTRPTLTWLLDVQLKTQARCRTSYLTRGLSWTADYSAVVAPDEASLNLEAWVSIDNHSGISYEEATIKLIAGQIHRAPDTGRPPLREARVMSAPAEIAPAVQERSFFDYQIYDLPGQISLKDKHTKQISLMKATNIPAQKVYVFEKEALITPYRRYDPAPNKVPVKIMLELVNKKKHYLGMALPQGKMRVYKQDKEQNLRLIGEDMLRHTPEGEKIRLNLGIANDIIGEHVQTGYKKLGDKAYQAEYQLTIRNRKPTPVKITIIEHPTGGDWRIVKSNVPFTKKDVRTAEAIVEVTAKGEKEITYTIRVER
jgi:hypothetical protein